MTSLFPSDSKSGRGGARAGAGRPPGPPDAVRPHRVVISVSTATLEKLDRLAALRRLPIGGLAHELLLKELHRRKRRPRPKASA